MVKNCKYFSTEKFVFIKNCFILFHTYVIYLYYNPTDIQLLIVLRYVPKADKEKRKITREMVNLVLARKPKMCNFIEWKDLTIVYKRYASLFFCFAIDKVSFISQFM